MPRNTVATMRTRLARAATALASARDNVAAEMETRDRLIVELDQAGESLGELTRLSGLKKPGVLKVIAKWNDRE
jgi:hypothetical protein